MARSAADLLGDLDEDEDDIVEDDDGHVETDWAKLRQGVTIAWLHGLLRMDKKTIKKRLGLCKPKGKNEAGYTVYDIADAMSYLVKPRFDIRDYMKTMNPTELPPMLRKEYWDAENKRATFMERAAELWSTESVIEVFSDVAKIMKTSMQVWADDVEREAGMTPEQYKALIGRVDALRDTIANRLGELAKSGTLKAHVHSIGENDAEDSD